MKKAAWAGGLLGATALALCSYRWWSRTQADLASGRRFEENQRRWQSGVVAQSKPSASRTAPLSPASFIISKKYAVGDPALFKIYVRPIKEAEVLGQGIEMPEWYGKLEVRSVRNVGAKPLYSLGPISGIKLSTAGIIADFLPSSKCLWIVYKSYGWSDPHCTTISGELFKIDGDNLLKIWDIQLLEECEGGGTGYKKTSDYLFSNVKDSSDAPTISVTSKVWADTFFEVEHLPLKPKRVEENIYVFDGRNFVLRAPDHPGLNNRAKQINGRN